MDLFSEVNISLIKITKEIEHNITCIILLEKAIKYKSINISTNINRFNLKFLNRFFINIPPVKCKINN